MVEKVYVVMSSFGIWDDWYSKVDAVFLDQKLAELHSESLKQEYADMKTKLPQYPDDSMIDTDPDEYERLWDIASNAENESASYNKSWVVEHIVKHEL